MWWVQVFPEEALKWRNFGVFTALKVRQVHLKNLKFLTRVGTKVDT